LLDGSELDHQHAGRVSSLHGRTAIVTGSSRGIGHAIALELARRGANVVVAARTIEERPPWVMGTIEQAVATITNAGGRALAFEVDVRDDDRVGAMVRATVEEFGGVDVLVNNAGAFRMKPAVSTTPREFRLVLDVNVAGAFACISHCLPHLARSPHAHVLNIAPPLRTEAYWAAGKLSHAVSKTALSVLTIGLAEELRPAHIAVNALWPKTIIATVGIERLGGEPLTKLARKPEVTAEAAALLLSSPPAERTGECVLDEDVLRAAGVEDFARFAVDPASPLLANFFVDPAETLR
jgi:citronellol/citronellal dehydrogenase